MDVPGESLSKPIRPRLRIARRISLAVVCIALFAGISVTTIQTARLRWRSFTFPADPHTGLAVVADYPDTVRCTVIPHTFSSEMELGLERKPPTGLARWWMEKVLGQNLKPYPWNRVEILVDSGVHLNWAVREKQWLTRYKGVRTDHFRHALGPALQMTYILDAKTARMLLNDKTAPPFKIRTICIAPTTSSADKQEIRANYDAPEPGYERFEPLFNEMVRRIHFVRNQSLVRD